MKPKIHLVFSEMMKLLRAIMAKSVKSKLLYVNHNSAKEPKFITELITINVNDQKKLQNVKAYWYWHKDEILFYRFTRSFTCQ